MSDSNQPEWKLLEKVALASVNEQKKARRWGILFKILTFVYLFALFSALFSQDETAEWKDTLEPHVAVIDVQGIIASEEPASAAIINTSLRDAFANDMVKAVILNVNSPGGSPVQSSFVYDEIKRLREQRPEVKVYAAIADLGASGAYYIAAAADEIYADPSSLVGSIGVISASFGFDQAMAKHGIERRLFIAGQNKAMLDQFSPLDPVDAAHWQLVLQSTHETFIDRVKRGRGDRLKSDASLFTGYVYSGEQAKELGLIDGFGSVSYIAREIVGIDSVENYTVPPSPFERMLRDLGLAVSSGVTQALYSAPRLY